MAVSELKDADGTRKFKTNTDHTFQISDIVHRWSKFNCQMLYMWTFILIIFIYKCILQWVNVKGMAIYLILFDNDSDWLTKGWTGGLAVS